MNNLMQKQKYSHLERFIASTLIVFLLIEPGVFAASYTAEKNNPVSTIELPQHFGRIEESWTGDTGKTVIFIQDAHDSLEAQENIAKMIRYLVDRHGIKTVYEEGFEGPVPTDKYFRKIKDPEIREKTAYFLMDKLRIGGAEYAHITRNKEFELIGADNLKLYRKNIEWYQDSAANKNATEKDLGVMDASIRKLAARYFTKDMKEWMSLKERFDGHQIDLLGYLKRVMSLSEESEQLVSASTYPNISLLLNSEKSNDPLVLEKVKLIEGKRLFEEMGRLEDDYARISLADGRARMIFDYFKTLQLLKRLNAIEVTEEEYGSVKEKLKALDTSKIARFIAEQNGKSVVLSRLWEKHIQGAMGFYETAHQRDSSIQPLLKEYLERAGNEPAVLVYGGFHKESIKKILKENNLSYKVVTPKISSVSAKHRAYYKTIMRMGYDDIALPAALPKATRPPSLLILSESGDLESKARVDGLIDQVADIAVSRNDIPEMDLEWTSRSETRSIPNPQIAALLKTLLDDALNPELEKSDRIYSILRIGEISKEAVKIKELGAAFIRPDQDQALAFAALQAIWEIIIFSPGQESLVMGLDILASAFMNEQLAPAVQILAGRLLLFYIRRPHSSDDKIFAAIEIGNKINSDQKTPGAVISKIIERINEIPGDVTTYAEHVMGELDQTTADVNAHLQESKSEDLMGIYGDRFEEIMTFEGMLKGALIDYFEDVGWKGNPYYLFDQISFFLGVVKKVDFDKYPVIVRDLYKMGKRVWISAKSWKNLKDSGAANAPRSETRQTLARIFGPGKIKNVFEFAAGDGAWLNKLSKPYAFPWLDPDPVLAGFELPEPVYYADYGYASEDEMFAAFKEKWGSLSERGIQIYTKESEIPGTEFDLLHVAFQPHDPDDLVFLKLSRFEKKLRPGGWVVFANDENIMLRSEANRWLLERGYPFQEIHVFNNSEIPKDYPFSTWGEIQSKHTRYLIVAQKPLFRSETRQSDDSEMKKMMMDALRQEAEDWGVDPDGVMADYKFYAFPPFTVMVSYDAEKDVVGIAMGKKDSENPRAYLIERGGKHVQVTQLAGRAGVEIKIFKEAGDLEPDDSFVVGHTEKGVYFFIVTVEGGQKVSDPEITLFDDWTDAQEAPRSEARAGKIPVNSEHLREIVELLNEARVVDKQELKSLKVRVKKEVRKIDPAKQSQLETILLMSVTSANELADGEELDAHIMRGALERLNAQISEGTIEYIPRQGTFTLTLPSAPVEKKDEPRDEISSKEILPADFIRESRFFKQGIIRKIYKNHQKVQHLHLSVSAERIIDPGLAFKLQQRLNRAGDELVYLTLKVRFPGETRYISLLDTGINLNAYTLKEILEGKDSQGETLLNQFELLLSVSEYRDAFHLRLISVGNETESKKINGDYKNHAEILQGEGYGQEIFSEMARWLRFRAAEEEKKIEISTIDGSAGKWTAKRMREFFNAEQITRKSKRYGAVSKREEILPGNTNDVWAGWITPESSPRSEARFAVSTKQLASQNVVFVDGAAEYQNPRDVAEELAVLASSNPKQKVIVYNMRSEMRSFQNLHTLSADLKSFDLSNVQFVDGSLVEAARPYQYRENLDLVYYGNDKGEAVKAIQEMGVFSKRVTYFVGKPGALGYGLKYLPAVKLSKRVENLILQNGYYVVSPQASEWMRAIQQAQFVTVFARSA